MSYPINYPTPQGANVQIFRGGGNDQTGRNDWVKPQGASFVWFTLIGAGGGGGGGFMDDSDPANPIYTPAGGGASGGVTNFMCPAFLLPNVLQIAVGAGGNGGGAGSTTGGVASAGDIGQSTGVYYQQKAGSNYEIAIAFGGGGGGQASSGGDGSGGVGTTTSVVKPMLAAGFYNTTVGAAGAAGGVTITIDNVTFLMGGNGTNLDTSTPITGYYGYTATVRSGYSQLSPIPLAISRRSTQSYIGADRRATPQSFGCGGSAGGSTTSISSGSKGGDGLVVVVTW
jgi:hypothetical protein